MKTLHQYYTNILQKTWSDEARQASAEKRKVEHQEALAFLGPDKYKDYMSHRSAGTPHDYAIALAEGRPPSSFARFEVMNQTPIHRRR